MRRMPKMLKQTSERCESKTECSQYANEDKEKGIIRKEIVKLLERHGRRFSIQVRTTVMQTTSQISGTSPVNRSLVLFSKWYVVTNRWSPPLIYATVGHVSARRLTGMHLILTPILAHWRAMGSNGNIRHPVRV
jgi:hypothetical protein